jgi:pimeloyl-ACP methyl ester carboxylesterase
MIEKTLIILPGWGGSHETWENFANLAKEKFVEVKIIDLPCFGTEPCPDTVWGVKEYSEFVKSKISNQKSAILLGHSFGGAVASYLVANNPGLVEKLILSGASVLRPEKCLRRLFFNCLAKCGKIIFSLPPLKKLSAAAKKLLYRAADSQDYAKTSGIKREIFKRVITEDLSDLLPKIITPTLIVWGSKDRFIPLSSGKKVNALIPGSKLVIFAGGRHGLHLQQPEELLAQVSNFAN